MKRNYFLSKLSMLSKKNIFLGGMSVIGCIATSFVYAEAPSGMETYAGYKEQLKEVCKAPSSSELFWNSAKQHPVLRDTTMIYSEIGDTNTTKTYSEAAKSFGADISLVLRDATQQSVLFELDSAKTLYTARMNAIYACAVLDAKNLSAKAIIKYIGRGRDEEMVRSIEAQIARNEELKTKRNCNQLNLEPTEMKKTLLDNTWYEYCNYRNYLGYLEANATHRVNETMEANTKNFPNQKSPTSSEEYAYRVKNIQSAISDEIARSRDVFPKALVAYTEFERNYGSHIVLQFILDDYIKIRESLQKVMNPLSQLMVKGWNAQTQPGGK